MNYLFIITGCVKTNSSFVRLRQLGYHLSELGCKIYYLLDRTAYNETLVDSINYAQVILISESNYKFGFRLDRIFARRKSIKDISPDVVHFLNPSPNNTASIVGVSSAVKVSDWDELLSQRRPTLPYRIVHYICESIARQQADLITVSSRHLQQYFQEKFNHQSIYLPYATYLENIEVGLNPFTRPTAVYMGNLHHDGDHDILIDAWTILESQGKAPDLCMIGGGPCLNDVKANVESKKLTSVNIRGYLPVEEMWTALCHAHVLLFPIRDTIGNQMRCPSKTFAYMQAGRPIVTCRVGEVAEALGEQAIYVEPTPEAFAQTVQDLFQQSLAQVPYDLSRHTWESRAQDLLTAIQALR